MGRRVAARCPAGAIFPAMTSGTTLVISDAHLGAVPSDRERRLISFLRAVPDLGDELLINGDLFDFWFEWRHVVLREHFPVLRALAELTAAGIPVRMVGGNHDAWGGDFLREEIGVEWIEGPVRTRVGGRKAYLAHGDGLAGGDWGYRLLKAVIRSRPARAMFGALHPDLARALVDRVSRTDREVRGGATHHRAEELSRHADEILRDEPGLELVVFGHSHRPELREGPGGGHYLNPGDWIHHFTYGVVSPGELRLEEWEPPQPPPTGTS